MISTLPRRMAPIAVLATGVGSAAIALAPAAHADTNTVTFSYAGTEQTWVVPSGVTSLHVVAIGGQGGNSLSPQVSGTEPGGAGGLTMADLAVTPNQQLFVEVGGNGQDGNDGSGASAPGGFNGGGTGAGFFGAGGGGASDIRTVSSSAASGSLESRLLVAAGGGGAALDDEGGDSTDDGGSGMPGYPHDSTCPSDLSGAPGGGATTSGPGTGGQGFIDRGGDGRPGTGGDGGGATVDVSGGGAGGGGWYGGGGGGEAQACPGAGGGGSSYLDPATGRNPVFAMSTTTTPQITISYLVPRAPLATTEPASSVGQTSATLNGVVNPEGFATSYHFAYGTDPNNESNSTTQTDVDPTDSGQHDVSATIPSLSPGTTYYFRLVSHNDNGDASGQDLQFTTTAATATGRAPLATTSPASGVGWTKAQLNGVVNARGALTSYCFQWGTTTAYGQTTPAQNVGPAWGNHSVKAPLTGLTRHTTYHFRLVATNANGTVQGVDRTFRTG